MRTRGVVREASARDGKDFSHESFPSSRSTRPSRPRRLDAHHDRETPQDGENTPRAFSRACRRRARVARRRKRPRPIRARDTARDDYAPSLTPYTREDASHLAETPGVKRLDPGVRVLAVACRDERTGALVRCSVIRFVTSVCTTRPRARSSARCGRESGEDADGNDAPSPWPNVFWLVDRGAARRVGRLEHGGRAAALQRYDGRRRRRLESGVSGATRRVR